MAGVDHGLPVPEVEVLRFFGLTGQQASGNLIVGAPIGGQTGIGVRPYGSVGLGLLRSNVSSTGP